MRYRISAAPSTPIYLLINQYDFLSYIVTLMIDCDSVSESEANHVLQLCNLLTGCEDALLHE